LAPPSPSRLLAWPGRRRQHPPDQKRASASRASFAGRKLRESRKRLSRQGRNRFRVAPDSSVACPPTSFSRMSSAIGTCVGGARHDFRSVAGRCSVCWSILLPRRQKLLASGATCDLIDQQIFQQGITHVGTCNTVAIGSSPSRHWPAFAKLYKRSKRDEAYVRTGLGGQKVVLRRLGRAAISTDRCSET